MDYLYVQTDNPSYNYYLADEYKVHHEFVNFMWMYCFEKKVLSFIIWQKLCKLTIKQNLENQYMFMCISLGLTFNINGLVIDVVMIN